MADSQDYPVVVADGTGGAIVVWERIHNGNTDIFAQRVNAQGVVQWTADGARVCDTSGNQNYKTCVGDGAGGVIVAWSDTRSGTSQIYAQRISSQGIAQWTPNGIRVCLDPRTQSYPRSVNDGTGGAIIAWSDSRSNPNTTIGSIYTQKVSAQGVLQWNSGGVLIPLANANYYQWDLSSQLGSDGSGGAIIAYTSWYYYPSPTMYGRLLCAQRISAQGGFPWGNEPTIVYNVYWSSGLPSNQVISPVSDGAGGAIILSEYDGDIWSDHVNANGSKLTSGFICRAAGLQRSSVCVSDGTGGAIVAWIDPRTGKDAIYAQRVNGQGALQWATDGVKIRDTTSTLGGLAIASDGAEGAIIIWHDKRSGNADVYALRVSPQGAPLWTPNGVTLCSHTAEQVGPGASSDGAGGALVAWTDRRNGASNPDIYAQNVDLSGHLGNAPSVTRVKDVVNDQGGRVSLLWNRSHLDALPNSYLSTYEFYRGVPSSMGHSSFAVLPETEYAQRKASGNISHTYLATGDLTRSGLPIYWEYAGSTTARKLENYSYTVTTFSDSGPQGNSQTYFMVRGVINSTTFWDSAPDSGYSVDNLPPSTPSGGSLVLVASNTIKVSWDPNQVDPDVGYYAVYRSPTSNFTPSPSTLLGTTPDTLYMDTGGGGVPYFYRVTTVDLHGNQSIPTPEMSLAHSQSVPAGWNMIGLPGSVANSYYRTVYPTAAVGTLYRFSGSYIATDSLRIGTGYWLKFPSATSVTILSVPVQSNSVTLAAGWNMIAGLSCSVPLSTISDPGGILVAGTLYAFNGAYASSTTLERGRGYWIKARSAGTVSMTCGSTPKPADEMNTPLADVGTAPALTIADASGAQQTLYWNVLLKDPSTRESYSLPPLPAEGCFDVRFAGDYRLTEGSEALITIQTDHYPVTITEANVPVGTDSRYVLVEMEGNKEGVSHGLTSGATFEIQNASVKSLMLKKESTVPLEFSLEQNYPNPFNPTTIIRYALPSPSRVTLTVFNTLGQSVRELANAEVPAGYHAVQFDASGLSSGVYYYCIHAGSFVDVKKLILVR